LWEGKVTVNQLAVIEQEQSGAPHASDLSGFPRCPRLGVSPCAPYTLIIWLMNGALDAGREGQVGFGGGCGRYGDRRRGGHRQREPPNAAYIRYGNVTSGIPVRCVQQMLNSIANAHSYPGPPAPGTIAEDGSFGPATYNMVEWLQTAYNSQPNVTPLSVDGVVGPATGTVLLSWAWQDHCQNYCQAYVPSYS
jgi:hypothetical protein